jgi:hypothetical protein
MPHFFSCVGVGNQGYRILSQRELQANPMPEPALPFVTSFGERL